MSLNKLFPYTKYQHKLQIDKDSYNYITNKYYSTKITNIIIYHMKLINLYPKTCSIIDATAGVGGNTLSFANYFKKVYAIEIDKSRSSMLENNISIYNFTNIQVINNDFTTIYNNISSEIVFIDPPWGGKDYKKYYRLQLSLSGITIEDLCIQITARIIVLKLPLNYDLFHLYSKLNFYKIYIYNLTKMLIIIIHRLL